MKAPREKAYYAYVVSGKNSSGKSVTGSYIARAVSENHGMTRARHKFGFVFGWSIERIQFVQAAPYTADHAEQDRNCEMLLAACRAVKSKPAAEAWAA